MRDVPLTHGKTALVDDDDWPSLEPLKWQAVWTGYAWYASGYDPETRKTVYMHRRIMSAPKGLMVDHINHDGLDNRRSNLRLCTNAQNNHNVRGLSVRNRHGFIGVCFYPKRKKPWQAQLACNGVVHTRGYFHTAEDAARARDELAKQYHGEFASLNFPEGA